MLNIDEAKITEVMQKRYHRELYPDLMDIEVLDKGDWIDLRCAEKTEMKAGEIKVIPLGISSKLPDGYTAIIAPRSSTLRKYGILMGNSIGIIDESYCGDNDIWGFVAYAIRDTVIEVNERICQFKIEPKMSSHINLKLQTVEKLDGPDRGGIGSTGTI